MNEILKALQNRKMEVELKSEVVELGLVDDVKKLALDAVNEAEKLGEQTRIIISAQERMKKIGGNANANVKKALDKIENYKKALKDLGISDSEMPSKISSWRNDVLKAQKRVDRDLKKFVSK